MASDEGLSRDESRQMRDIGRQAMSQVVGVALKQAVSHDLLRTFAVVSKVNGDGTVDLECGSEETPMPLNGVRLTLGCSTVEVGDTVVVDTYDHSPLVVSVLYSNASSGHTVASKPEVNAAKSAADQALSEAKTAKAASDAAQESAASAKESADAATESAKTAQAKAEDATESAATAQSKAEDAGNAATKAQSDAASAKTAATAAQAKADEAATAASTAQSKADTASTAAATAQSKAEDATTAANNAGKAAANAQAAAEAAQGDIDEEKTYFWHDSEGAHVLGEAEGYRSDVKSDGLHVLSAKDSTELANFTASGAQIGKTSGTHVTLDSDSLDIMDGTTTSASFGASTIDLGTESATINMAGKKLSIDVHTVTGGSSNSHRYDYIRLIIPTTSSASSNYNSSLQICSRDMTSGDMSYGMRIDCGYGEQGGTTVTLDGSLIANKTIYANAASLKQPLSVTDGGTGATNADGARANLGLDSASIMRQACGINNSGHVTDANSATTPGIYSVYKGANNIPSSAVWGLMVVTKVGDWINQTLINNYTNDGQVAYTRSLTDGKNWGNWQPLASSNEKSVVPIYRLRNPYTGVYLYTSSSSEYNSLISAGWSGEDTNFYAFN